MLPCGPRPSSGPPSRRSSSGGFLRGFFGRGLRGLRFRLRCSLPAAVVTARPAAQLASKLALQRGDEVDHLGIHFGGGGLGLFGYLAGAAGDRLVEHTLQFDLVLVGELIRFEIVRHGPDQRLGHLDLLRAGLGGPGQGFELDGAYLVRPQQRLQHQDSVTYPQCGEPGLLPQGEMHERDPVDPLLSVVASSTYAFGVVESGSR